MRRLFYVPVMIMAAAIVFGCTKETASTISPEGDLVLVHLDLAGEVDVDETPLTKAFTSNDLIGVQVYQESSYYAYGLFDDVAEMNIYLHTGKTYKFVCSVVKNGKSIVYQYTSNISLQSFPIGNENKKCVFGTGQYSLPFMAYDESSSSFTFQLGTYHTTSLNNAFTYSSADRFVTLEYGRIESDMGAYNQKYAKADRFYGEISGYNPSSNDLLSIPMKRVGFGLTLSVTGITDGNVAVTIKNSDQTIANNANITQDKQFGTTMWSFYDLRSAWQYADNYAENFTVGVIWNRGVGVTQDLGTKTVQFKRNAVNHVKINLGALTKSADLSITLEDPVITTENYTFGN